MKNRHGLGMVLIIGGLHFGIAFLAPLSVEFNKAAEYKYYPEKIRVQAALLAGAGSGLAALLAFLNPMYTRYSDTAAGTQSVTTQRSTVVEPPPASEQSKIDALKIPGET